jgi:hypothetical protein
LPASSSASGGGIDQFRPSVGGVGAAIQVTEVLQIVHQFGGRGQAQLGPRGELGESYAVDADVAEDLQVRLAEVGIATLGRGREQFGPKLP